MINKEDLEKVIQINLQVDEVDGMQDVTTVDTTKLHEIGIVDVTAFIHGFMDASRDKEFDDSSIDYVKGYKYGKTNSF